MKTIYHPGFPGLSREVPEKDADAWKAQGWRFTPLSTPPAEPAPKAKKPVERTPVTDVAE